MFTKIPKVKVTKYFVVMLSLVMVFSISLGHIKVSEAATSAELAGRASSLDRQIKANAQKVKDLQAQADSLKKTVAELDIQIADADSQIELTSVKIDQLQVKLVEAQDSLDRQKELLRNSMRALYKKGGASTVELLVGSNSFSDFINNQEYLDRLKSSIQTSTEEVIVLKQQIQSQKNEQEDLKKKLVEQRRSLDETKQSRQSLLEKTQGDEAAYSDLIKKQIEEQQQVNKELFAQIQLEKGDGTNGAYPYANWPFSMRGPGCPSGDGPDRWGYCTRQCVSYAAWAVERSGRRAPYGYGNARDWVWHAKNDGILVTSSPKAGDVAIHVAGAWGHAQYVDAVNGDGTIRISQYNAMLDGRYSEATVPESRSNWYFIRFP
jgi:peptidoglycan hydrolase CwlO-like protein